MEARVRKRGQPIVKRANRNLAMKGRSWVYFAQAGTDGLVKIGQSRQVHRRLTALNSSSCEKIRLLGTIPETVASEDDIHIALHSLRVRGEWFEPHPIVLQLADAGRRVYGNGYRDEFDDDEALILFIKASMRRLLPRAQVAEITRLKGAAA